MGISHSIGYKKSLSFLKTLDRLELEDEGCKEVMSKGNQNRFFFCEKSQ